jgi:hypothetical protein
MVWRSASWPFGQESHLLVQLRVCFHANGIIPALRLSIVQTAQAGVLKISVGDEKRGLGAE